MSEQPCKCRYAMLTAKIVFCPLHQAAGELLEALKRAADHMLFRGWAIHQGHECRDVYEQVLAAIGQAEGTRRPEEG